ncbi:MAG: lipopolysaccharide heptosyltransferase I [Burkholderiales bacterium]|jgi:heptosyltransferase-1|nr:lipopolysaccharide heptosyltransferase I [Burkholderiales bacterium]
MSASILIIRTSSLGDVVYASAVLHDIRRALPDAQVDWVAEEAFAAVPQLAGARRVIPFALRRWRRRWYDPQSWRELAAFRQTLRETRYDIVIDLNEQVKSALIARAAFGKRHGFNRASIREPLACPLYQVTHAVSRELHFVERCRQLTAAALHYVPEGLPRWQWAWEEPSPSSNALLTPPETPYVMLLHATSRDDKLWPEDRWHALIHACHHRGLQVLLPWGNAKEQARSERLAVGHENARVLPKASLPELAVLLKKATWAAGVDTGLTHWSAALGTPTVAIFTATSPCRLGVGVQGEHAVDLGETGAPPEVDAVLETVSAISLQAHTSFTLSPRGRECPSPPAPLPQGESGAKRDANNLSQKCSNSLTNTSHEQEGA